MPPPNHRPQFLEDFEPNQEFETNTYNEVSLTIMAFYYAMFLIGIFTTWFLVYCCLRCLCWRQKTREPQQRRMYVGSRVQSSISHQQQPTIYVSPSNLPPPPKYEVMAPPSYEEVCGIHYPNYQPPMTRAVPVQPITQPIITAVAQSTNQSDAVPSHSSNHDTTLFSPGIPLSGPANVLNQGNHVSTSTVITVDADRRKSSVTATSQQV